MDRNDLEEATYLALQRDRARQNVIAAWVLVVATACIIVAACVMGFMGMYQK